jgi:tetratricopeptide (TPR) repeat protein
MRSAVLVLICMAIFPAIIPAQAAVQDMLTQGDALRSQGDYAGALSVYQQAIASGGESSEAWKRVAWAQKALHHFDAARQAFEKALTLSPNDKEAQDDLASLNLSRGLALRTWVGGTEPGTSRTAADGEVWFGGIDQLDISAGGGWTDNIFYYSWKGFASAYWFFLPESYAKLKLGLWGYTYTVAAGSVPDSNAYQYDPRVEAEVSHWFTGYLRASLAYQLDVPNFQYDTSTWIMTHKLTTELETRFGGLHLWGTAGMLYDPDPNRTVVANSPGNTLLAPTTVAYRYDFLYGVGASYEGSIWSLGARLLTNRDLDSSYAWSVISRFTVQPVDKLSFDLEWILDQYSVNAGVPYANNYGSILWGEVGYEVLRGVVLSAGVKWVDNPGPTSVTNASPRNDVSVLVNLVYKTGLW